MTSATVYAKLGVLIGTKKSLAAFRVPGIKKGPSRGIVAPRLGRFGFLGLGDREWDEPGSVEGSLSTLSPVGEFCKWGRFRLDLVNA